MSSEPIYEAHLAMFDAAAGVADPVERAVVAARQCKVLERIVDDWEALRDLAVDEAYRSGTNQVEIHRAMRIDITRQRVNQYATRGRQDRKRLTRIVAAARYAAERMSGG